MPGTHDCPFCITYRVSGALTIFKQAEPSNIECKSLRRRLQILPDVMGLYNQRLFAAACRNPDGKFQFLSIGQDDCDDDIQGLTISLGNACTANFNVERDSDQLAYNALLTSPTDCGNVAIETINSANIEMQYYGLKGTEDVANPYQESYTVYGGISRV